MHHLGAVYECKKIGKIKYRVYTPAEICFYNGPSLNPPI